MGQSQWTIESGVPFNRNPNGFDAGRHGGPRNPDGTWMAGVVRGPFKPFPVAVGTQQGDLTVVSWEQEIGKDGSGQGWNPRVRCACGWEGMVHRSNFINKKTQRCGNCARKQSAKTRKQYWGYADIVPDDSTRERLLNRISSCINRCEIPTSSQYANYGGRGIRVYKEWTKDRRAFLQYIVSLPGWDNPLLELDRIDNERGYEPGNLQWSTRYDNASNRRTVQNLQKQIERLKAENADLRHRLGGA